LKETILVKKAKELEDRQQTFEQDLIRSYTSPATPRVDPHKSPAPNGLIPGMNPSLPIHTEPPKVTFVPETPKPPYPVAFENPFNTVPQPIVEKPRFSNDLSQLPPDIDADDISILQSMGFNLDDKPHVIFDLIRKHKDISKVIEELLKK